MRSTWSFLDKAFDLKGKIKVEDIYTNDLLSGKLGLRHSSPKQTRSQHALVPGNLDMLRAARPRTSPSRENSTSRR